MSKEDRKYQIHPEELGITIDYDEDIMLKSTSTNEYVLNVAFISFVLFMILQGSFAVIAKSEAMLADTMAMSVDAFTYLFNLVAERLKHHNSSIFLGNTKGISYQELARRRKKLRLYLEFIPPLLSVTALILVSLQALKEAMHTIINHHDTTPDNFSNNEDDIPNVHMMLFFSTLNLGLDIMNVTCFAKAKHFSLGGIRVLEDKSDNIASLDYSSKNSDVENALYMDLESDQETFSERKQLVPKKDTGNDTVHHDIVEYGSNQLSSTIGVYMQPNDEHIISVKSRIETLSIVKGASRDKINMNPDGASSECTDDNYDDDDVNDVLSEASSEESSGLNLNMCSAYTHIMADTMRSIAVLIAATLAYYFNEIDPSIADACASIVVSLIISVSLGPLLLGLIETWKEITALQREKKHR